MSAAKLPSGGGRGRIPRRILATGVTGAVAWLTAVCRQLALPTRPAPPRKANELGFQSGMSPSHMPPARPGRASRAATAILLLSRMIAQRWV